MLCCLYMLNALTQDDIKLPGKLHINIAQVGLDYSETCDIFLPVIHIS